MLHGARSLLRGDPRAAQASFGSIFQPGVRDLLPTSLAGARLVLRQEMAALTLKQEGGPGEKLLPCWPWGETTYPAPGLVPCSDLGSAAGGRGLR